MTTEERLVRLEGELATARRRARGAMTLAVLAFGLAALIGFHPSLIRTTEAQDDPEDEVRARNFVVVDEEGTVRARLGMDEKECGLVLMDEKGEGKLRGSMTVRQDGPQISFCGADEKPRLGISADKDGSGMYVVDAKGKVRAVLFVGKDGPEIQLCDPEGKPVWSAPPPK